MARKRDDGDQIERALAPNTGLTSEKMDTNSVVKSVSSDKIAGRAGGAVFGREDRAAAGVGGAGESLVELDNPDDVDTYLDSGGNRASDRGEPGGGGREDRIPRGRKVRIPGHETVN